jgi:iron complex outermembrane recepter protein
MKKHIYAMLAVTSITMVAAVASAADQSTGAKPATTQASAENLEEVIVTGTLIRGVAPGGSTVISVSKEQIAATGATNTNDMLSSLPQGGAVFFNNVAFGGSGVVGGNARTAIVRPNIRNLPGGSTATGSQTLILMDGHRLVGAGIGLLAIDAEIIPPALIERVETITDGGSALYGSDAIGGVINFITRKKFDGFQIDARYGAADSYSQNDVSVTMGKGWSGGSAFLGYTNSHHGSLKGLDRDFIKQIDWATGIPTGRQCDFSNITRSSAPGQFFVGPNPTVPVAAPISCDLTDYQTLVPNTHRDNMLAGFTQQLSDTLELDIRGYYSDRSDVVTIGALRSATSAAVANLTIPVTNYYRQLLGGFGTETQQANFSYAPVLGNESNKNKTQMTAWGVTPTLTWQIKGSWQLRAMFNYGESDTAYANNAVNTTLQTAALAGTTLATAINPYSIASTGNLALVYDLGNGFIDRGESHNKLTNIRVVADGELFTMPGGSLRMAVGAEYMENAYRQRLTDATLRVFNPWASYAQDVKSGFAEFSVPVVGAGNRMTALYALNLSASVRYDKYNDFGDTTNPKFGLTYQPVDWVALRGTWGEAFNAPTPPDEIGATNGPRIRIIPSTLPVGFVPPPLTPPRTYTSIILDQAAVAGLRPQTSKDWSFGFNLRPPVAPGLVVDASYYHIDLKDLVNSPIGGTSQSFFAAYPSLFPLLPTPATVASYLATNPTTGPAIAATLVSSNLVVSSIIDNRSRNLGDAELEGIDFQITYAHPTDFGSIDASLAGNKQLKLNTMPSPTVAASSTPVDALVGQSDLRVAFTIGANIGKLRAQATLNHTAGYDFVPAATTYNQTSVGSFDVVNTFFQYHFDGANNTLTSDLSVSLNINNLFDSDPPEFRDSGIFSTGFANGLTVGRLIQFGVSKKF